MDQIAHAKEIEPFKVQAKQLWEHSLEVAAVSHVLAGRQGIATPDEALFTGLVHDLGHFYLMWRATKFPELVARPDDLRDIVHDWHPGIGSALLQSLDLPESISRACDEHELAPELLLPGSLSELLSVANREVQTGPDFKPHKRPNTRQWSREDAQTSEASTGQPPPAARGQAPQTAQRLRT
jgi:HD-like signal output (HDOD) protein